MPDWLKQLGDSKQALRGLFKPPEVVYATLVPRVIWRCPICHGIETLSAASSGGMVKRWSVTCAECGAVWDDVEESGMTLTTGPAEHLGRKHPDEWGAMASGSLDIETLDIPVPIILEAGEEPILMTQATLCRTVSKYNPGGIVGVGVPIGGVNAVVGQRVGAGESRELTAVDTGELILTTHRVVFKGSDELVNLPLKQIVAVEVDQGLLEIGHGRTTHRFETGSQSPVRWQAYVDGLARGAREV